MRPPDVVLGLGLIQQLNDGKNHSKKNGDDEDNGDDLQIEEMVEIFSRGISPVILPTIESLGAMDIQEAMAFSSSAGDVD